MPEGGTISVRAENRTAPAADGLAAGDYVVLTVSDKGCGISSEMLGQVMEPFFTTKDVGKGTGLGLSMVYGFAKQSGGLFRLDSTLGEGTRAEIWLPRAPAGTLVQPRDGKKAKPAAEAEIRPLSVLLVDDHEGVRTTTAGLLSDFGHRVIEATDGPEALGLLQANPDCCDILITDYAMPHVSGAEVIRQVREIRPELPAIIITGYADASSISRRPDNVAVLAKPFTPEQLNEAIRNCARDDSADAPKRMKAAS
jgi:CheY-like chemotaxis protein